MVRVRLKLKLQDRFITFITMKQKVVELHNYIKKKCWEMQIGGFCVVEDSGSLQNFKMSAL